jgi:hypothetical protein
VEKTRRRPVSVRSAEVVVNRTMTIDRHCRSYSSPKRDSIVDDEE